MGHRHIGTTALYCDVSEDTLRNAIVERSILKRVAETICGRRKLGPEPAALLGRWGEKKGPRVSGAKSGRNRLRERRWKNSHSPARNGCGNITASGNMVLRPSVHRPEQTQNSPMRASLMASAALGGGRAAGPNHAHP